MNRNLISDFPDLSNLTNLKILYLNFNLIRCIPGATLDRLVSLLELHVQNNRLTTPCVPDVLGPSGTLKMLDLRGNLLDSIPNLMNMGQSITYLVISYNKLTSLTDSDLDPFPLLTNLVLHHNRIETFLPLERNGLRLKTLHLAVNKIFNITADHLRPLKDCPNLDMRKNQLTSIPNLCANPGLTTGWQQSLLWSHTGKNASVPEKCPILLASWRCQVHWTYTTYWNISFLSTAKSEWW